MKSKARSSLYQPVIIDFLRTHLDEKSAVLGLSGGIDSSVVAYALVDAVGADRVHGFIMPSSHSQAKDVQDAHDIGSRLGIHVTEISIQPIIDAFQKTNSVFTLNKLAGMNLQARIRMTLLYGQANALGGMVVGTGNKTELQIGYFTKYGDGGVDLLPLGDLYKHQVYDLARELNIPESIIQKIPSAGLYAGQTDEAELGLSYDELDAILETMELGEDIIRYPSAQVERVRELQRSARHKLIIPPIARLTSFGSTQTVDSNGCALYIGRFQPFHAGHLSVLRDMTKQGYEKIIIGIGSSQYSRTPENPFSFAERKQMIETVLAQYPDMAPAHIVELPDIHDDAKWVDHVNTLIKQAGGKYDAVFSANAHVRDLFIQSGQSVAPCLKTVDVDATLIRKWIVDKNDRWRDYVDPLIQPMVQRMIAAIRRD